MNRYLSCTAAKPRSLHIFSIVLAYVLFTLYGTPLPQLRKGSFSISFMYLCTVCCICVTSFCAWQPVETGMCCALLTSDSGLYVRSEVIMVVGCQGMCLWDLAVVLWLTDTNDWEERAVSVFSSALKMERTFS
jgi:hypothetical protein